MKPITFSCSAALPKAGADIAASILDVANWTDFKGYGVLPGIKSAMYEVQTPGIVGSRIRVTNTDGSSHVEEIIEWDPKHSLRLQMNEFSPPLCRLATQFLESWTFQQSGSKTTVTRAFDLYPRSALVRPVLWLLSLLLKRAITKHLRQMRDK